MLYTIIRFYEFTDAFESSQVDHFSYQAYKELYDYLCDQDVNIEFDVTDIATNYNELTYSDVISEYGLDESATREDIIEYLNEHTCVIYTGVDSILFEVF